LPVRIVCGRYEDRLAWMQTRIQENPELVVVCSSPEIPLLAKTGDCYIANTVRYEGMERICPDVARLAKGPEKFLDLIFPQEFYNSLRDGYWYTVARLVLEDVYSSAIYSFFRDSVSSKRHRVPVDFPDDYRANLTKSVLAIGRYLTDVLPADKTDVARGIERLKTIPDEYKSNILAQVVRNAPVTASCIVSIVQGSLSALRDYRCPGERLFHAVPQEDRTIFIAGDDMGNKAAVYLGAQAMDAEVAEDDKSRSDGRFPEGGYKGHQECHSRLALDTVGKQIDDFHVHVRGIKQAPEPKLDLVSLKVAEGPVEARLHSPVHSSRRLELSRAGGSADLYPVEPGLPVAAHGRGVHGTGSKGVGRDEAPSAFLRHTHIGFLHGFVVPVGKRGLVVFKGPHLLELFLHPPFQGKFHQFPKFVGTEFPVGIDQLHQSRHRLPDGLYIPRVQVGAEGIVVVHDLGEILPPKFLEGLRNVVHHEAVVFRKEFHPHLRHFPSGKVKMDAVRMTWGMGAKRLDVRTSVSTGWFVLPKKAIEAIPLRDSFPRAKLPDSQ
jgi:hypothetical protein